MLASTYLGLMTFLHKLLNPAHRAAVAPSG